MLRRRLLLIIVALPVVLVMFMLSCKGPEGPMGPTGPSGSLNDPAVMPEVIYTFPPANSQGPYEVVYPPSFVIQLRFNKVMDITTIKHGVHVSAPNTGVRLDTTFLYTFGGDLFWLYMIDTAAGYAQWKIGKTYTLTVDTTVKDIHGNHIQPVYSMTFTPEPYFRVAQVAPANGRQDVPIDASIGLAFNSIVDTSILRHLQISPNIAGSWYLDPATAYYEFAYDTLMHHQTLYTITVTGGAHDTAGNQLREPFTSTFRTVAFKVSATSPSANATKVPLFTPVEIGFSAPIDTGTVRSAFLISPAVSGSLGLNYRSSYFTFYPIAGLDVGTQYTVTIASSLRSMRGDRMDAPYSFSFTTVPFAITDCIPADGDSDVFVYPTINVYANSIIDTSTIRTAFSVQDSAGVPVPGTLGIMYQYAQFYWFPVTYLSNGKSYTIRISTALRAKSGAYLETPFVARFRVGNFGPPL